MLFAEKFSATALYAEMYFLDKTKIAIHKIKLPAHTKTRAKEKELRSAIESYIERNFDDEDEDTFAPEKSVVVEENDPVLGLQENEWEYNVPQSAIVIKSVKVKKY